MRLNTRGNPGLPKAIASPSGKKIKTGRNLEAGQGAVHLLRDLVRSTVARRVLTDREDGVDQSQDLTVGPDDTGAQSRVRIVDHTLGVGVDLGRTDQGVVLMTGTIGTGIPGATRGTEVLITGLGFRTMEISKPEGITEAATGTTAAMATIVTMGTGITETVEVSGGGDVAEAAQDTITTTEGTTETTGGTIEVVLGLTTMNLPCIKLTPLRKRLTKSLAKNKLALSVKEKKGMKIMGENGIRTKVLLRLQRNELCIDLEFSISEHFGYFLQQSTSEISIHIRVAIYFLSLYVCTKFFIILDIFLLHKINSYYKKVVIMFTILCSM